MKQRASMKSELGTKSRSEKPRARRKLDASDSASIKPQAFSVKVPKGERLLSIQLHFDKLHTSEVTTSKAEALRFLKSLAKGQDAKFVSCRTGKEDYANAIFIPSDLPAFWRGVKKKLRQQELEQATIVVCQGRYGWDDYLLLHHYDRTLKLNRPR